MFVVGNMFPRMNSQKLGVAWNYTYSSSTLLGDLQDDLLSQTGPHKKACAWGLRGVVCE